MVTDFTCPYSKQELITGEPQLALKACDVRERTTQ